MISKIALFCNILLASVALATPLSAHRAHLARRRENRRLQHFSRIESPANHAEWDNSGWAGAVLTEGSGTFATVTGTFTVPTLSGNSGDAISLWVGIDGASATSCTDAIWQAGVDITVSGGGGTSVAAWSQWYPGDSDYPPDFPISAGDVIEVTVTAFSVNTGVAVVKDLTTGQNITQHSNSNHPLCQQNAEWILEDFISGDGVQVPFGNFRTATFTNASAGGPGPAHQTYTPSGADTFDIELNDNVLTSSSIHGDTVTIKYI